MRPSISDDVQRAMLKTVLQNRGRMRLTMRGSSMHPLLREGMVLEVAPPDRPLRKADIVIFKFDERLIAHRVVEVRDDLLICSGDAQPDSVESVPRSEVLGVVEAVWAHDAPGAARVDTPWFRAAGRWCAYLRRARVLWLLASPSARPHTYRLLTDVISGIVQQDEPRILTALQQDPPWRLACVARRHRVEAILAKSVANSNSAHARALASRVRQKQWSSVLTTRRIRTQTSEVMRTLRAAGIEPVLLKGAARLFSCEPDAECFDAQDIDVLVSSGDVERASRALRDEGYRESNHPDKIDYERHHHAAPLFPPQAGVSVEIHRSLGHPHRVDMPWRLQDLESHLVVARDGAETALVFDRVARAIHLAVHGIQRPALREMLLLARTLQSMSVRERTIFSEALNREKRERTRIQAVAAFAARVAGISWHETDAVRRFVNWMVVREDLPRPLRSHTQCVDAWLSACGNSLIASLQAANDGPRKRRHLRAAARLFCGIAITVYGWLRSPDQGPL